ncbi:MAG: hypothetical protein HY951_04550 [Bacteroidia bacterium]|nr:hypothetical protein [Bacteroidia bacterium]
MDSNKITLVGIILTFLVSTVSLLITLFYARKTTFINAVTSSRFKYIQDFRISVSDYLGLIKIYQKLKNEPNCNDKKIETLKLLETSRFQILLFLNPENKIWDEYIINEIKELHKELVLNSQSTKSLSELEEIIDKFVISTQYLLKLEWEGAKLESKKGIINEREQSKLNKKTRKKLDKYLDGEREKKEKKILPLVEV